MIFRHEDRWHCRWCPASAVSTEPCQILQMHVPFLLLFKLTHGAQMGVLAASAVAQLWSTLSTWPSFKEQVEFSLPFPCFPCLPPLPSAGFCVVLITLSLMMAQGELLLVSDAASRPVSASDFVGNVRWQLLALSCGLECPFSPVSCFAEEAFCTHVCRRWLLVKLA